MLLTALHVPAPAERRVTGRNSTESGLLLLLELVAPHKQAETPSRGQGSALHLRDPFVRPIRCVRVATLQRRSIRADLVVCASSRSVAAGYWLTLFLRLELVRTNRLQQG